MIFICSLQWYTVYYLLYDSSSCLTNIHKPLRIHYESYTPDLFTLSLHYLYFCYFWINTATKFSSNFSNIFLKTMIISHSIWNNNFQHSNIGKRHLSFMLAKKHFFCANYAELKLSTKKILYFGNKVSPIGNCFHSISEEMISGTSVIIGRTSLFWVINAEKFIKISGIHYTTHYPKMNMQKDKAKFYVVKIMWMFWLHKSKIRFSLIFFKFLSTCIY